MLARVGLFSLASMLTAGGREGGRFEEKREMTSETVSKKYAALTEDVATDETKLPELIRIYTVYELISRHNVPRNQHACVEYPHLL